MTQTLTDLYLIENYIDTFALGHYARVLAARDLRNGREVAFKVMRPEHLNEDGDVRWEYRAFGSEAEILLALRESPHVVTLIDCGYISSKAEAPTDGEIISFGLDVPAFTKQMTEYAITGWRPYIVEEYMPRTRNLLYSMKPNQQGPRRRLPSEEGLALALQFGNLLKMAHDRNIVYLDHKLEHVYWDGTTLTVIDFNSSKQLIGSPAEHQEYTRDLHNLAVGILYPVFTGMSPQKTALRPQAGGQEAVDNRYKDVDSLDFMMEPTLSEPLQSMLNKGAAQQIPTAEEFLIRLQEIAALHGRDFPNQRSNPATRQARDFVLKGLEKLRSGEGQIREARDMFREALILDSISPDIEQELRRLVQEVNAMLNHRVIP
jgi:serine/threonine protein kinase